MTEVTWKEVGPNEKVKGGAFHSFYSKRLDTILDGCISLTAEEAKLKLFMSLTAPSNLDMVRNLDRNTLLRHFDQFVNVGTVIFPVRLRMYGLPKVIPNNFCGQFIQSFQKNYKFSYKVDIPVKTFQWEMFRWLREQQFGYRWNSRGEFYFLKPEEAMFFKLTWLGA